MTFFTYLSTIKSITPMDFRDHLATELGLFHRPSRKEEFCYKLAYERVYDRSDTDLVPPTFHTVSYDENQWLETFCVLSKEISETPFKSLYLTMQEHAAYEETHSLLEFYQANDDLFYHYLYPHNDLLILDVTTYLFSKHANPSPTPVDAKTVQTLLHVSTEYATHTTAGLTECLDFYLTSKRAATGLVQIPFIKSLVGTTIHKLLKLSYYRADETIQKSIRIVKDIIKVLGEAYRIFGTGTLSTTSAVDPTGWTTGDAFHDITILSLESDKPLMYLPIDKVSVLANSWNPHMTITLDKPVKLIIQSANHEMTINTHDLILDEVRDQYFLCGVPVKIMYLGRSLA